MDEILLQWNLAAKTYAISQETNEHVHANKSVLKTRFTDLSDRVVLDAGCGYGVYTDYFRSIGADAIGCDGSIELLKLAREKYPDCAFDLVDLQNRLPYCDEQFDVVFCNQVLMDISEIQGLFHEFSRITKENGVLYIAIVHPATYPGEWVVDKNGVKTAKIIKDYTLNYKCKHEFCGRTTHFHRPLSFYLNLAINNQFHLVHMEEPCTYCNDVNTSKYAAISVC